MKLRAYTLERLIKDMEGRIDYHRMVKTCLEMGMFSDGRVLLPLTDEEKKKFKAKFGRTKGVKEAKPLNVAKIMPANVKGMLDVVTHHPPTDEDPPLTELESSSSKKVYIDTGYYLLVVKRHPNSTLHLTGNDKTIAISERTTVGVLAVYKG